MTFESLTPRIPRIYNPERKVTSERVRAKKKSSLVWKTFDKFINKVEKFGTSKALAVALSLGFGTVTHFQKSGELPQKQLPPTQSFDTGPGSAAIQQSLDIQRQYIHLKSLAPVAAKDYFYGHLETLHPIILIQFLKFFNFDLQVQDANIKIPRFLTSENLPPEFLIVLNKEYEKLKKQAMAKKQKVDHIKLASDAYVIAKNIFHTDSTDLNSTHNEYLKPYENVPLVENPKIINIFNPQEIRIRGNLHKYFGSTGLLSRLERISPHQKEVIIDQNTNKILLLIGIQQQIFQNLQSKDQGNTLLILNGHGVNQENNHAINLFSSEDKDGRIKSHLNITPIDIFQLIEYRAAHMTPAQLLESQKKPLIILVPGCNAEPIADEINKRFKITNTSRSQKDLQPLPPVVIIGASLQNQHSLLNPKIPEGSEFMQLITSLLEKKGEFTVRNLVAGFHKMNTSTPYISMIGFQEKQYMRFGNVTYSTKPISDFA